MGLSGSGFRPFLSKFYMHTVENRFGKSVTSLRAMRIMTRYAPHNDTLGGKFQHFAASFRQAENLGPVKTMPAPDAGQKGGKLHRCRDFQISNTTSGEARSVPTPPLASLHMINNGSHQLSISQ